MSGRVRVTLADGRRVIGYRKTLARRGSRIASHLLPDWVLTFQLPHLLGLGLAPGPYSNLVGVSIGQIGLVTVAGKKYEWLQVQIGEFLRHVAPRGIVGPISVHATRPAEPGPTISGPPRLPAQDKFFQIEWDGKKARVVAQYASRDLARQTEASPWPPPKSMSA